MKCPVLLQNDVFLRFSEEKFVYISFQSHIFKCNACLILALITVTMVLFLSVRQVNQLLPS
jgi:hypothetical protein